jgi:hypothetical protein
MLTDLKVDGSLNGWMSDLADESMRYMERWLKMKEVIAGAKRSKLIEKSVILSFPFIATEAGVKFHYKLFGGSAGHSLFRTSSTFSFFPTFASSHNRKCSKDVAGLGLFPLHPFHSTTPSRTLLSLSPKRS